jgi:HAD superfamily hydrolase (TIGR01484 family)
MKKLIIFDLDGTLAESKAAIDTEMQGHLKALLDVVPVAVISGGDWSQFQQQIIGRLPQGADFSRLSMLPTCGTRFYEFDHGNWNLLYAEDLSDTQKTKIIAALNNAIKAAGITVEQTWGETIEDRLSQITYSALGQQAPLAAKSTWDPDFAKRKKIQALLAPVLADFSVRLGGSTSIDITKPGIDKAYGIRKLSEILRIDIADMLFIGDALFPGGNDAPARDTAAACIQVRDPNETKRVIEAIIACA